MRSNKSAPVTVLCLCTVILLTICFSVSVSAQNIFGRISGTVTDPTGAVVPNITVTITNEATKAARTTTTDDNGFYVAENLAVGSYTIVAEQTGFKRTMTQGVGLAAGARVTVNVNLEVGAPSETVQIEISSETVNTTSGEIARHIDQAQVQRTALNQRNYAQLVSLVPGAALTVFDQTTLTTGMSTTAASINGNRADGNLFTVDGGFNLDGGSNATQLNNVGLDFIREVAVQTSNYSAEYGRNNGASINVVTRSGGNEFHGGAFEFIRNDKLDAINYASKLNATATSPARKPTLRFNDFGWNLGGAIVKNKLFFFGGQEWKKIRQSATPQNMTIPTTAELSGNFSALTGLVLHAPPNAPPGCTIVNNIMSPACITADGRAIAAVYRLMGQQAASFSNTPTANNATFQPNNPQDWREDIIRIDYQITENQSLYGRYIHDALNLIDAFGTFTPGGLPTTPTNRIRPGFSYQVGHVWTISPSLINEGKVNISLNKQRIPPSGDTWKRETYGFAFNPPFGLIGTFPEGIPHVTFTGIGGGFPTAAPAQFTGPYFSLIAPTTDITLSDNFTWQMGKHSLKFGGMWAYNKKLQNSRPNSYNGAINFSTNGNPNTTGNPFADALMGNFQTFTQQSADPTGAFRFSDTEAYVNDSWRVNRKLSLELGLRYLHTGPTYTLANNMVNFDPSLFDPTKVPVVGTNNIPVGAFLNQGFVINGLVRPGAVPSGQLANVPGGDSAFVNAVPATAPRGFYNPENLFAPRLGFAYSPFDNDRTSIRGGFGIFYDKPEGNIIFGQPAVVPFLRAATFQNGNLANPSSGTGATPTIFGMSAVDPNFKVARTYQYSVSVQHQLPYDLLLEIAYVGNRARNLVRQPNINVPTFATALSHIGQTTNQQRPFLGYTDITQFRSDASSHYNGLQIYVTKRKGDLTGTVSYTFSKANGNASGINDNPEPECPFTCQLANGTIVSWEDYYYGPLAFDRRHVFVFTYTYDIPFFRDRKGIEGALLSGWQVSGITRAQSGAPLTINGSQTIGPAGSGVTAFTRRANRVNGVDPYSGFTCPAGKVCWFNPAAFAAPSTTGAGDSAVGSILGPGYYDWDVSVRKIFKLPREGMTLAFQADAFNLFNRVNYANPAVTVTGGGFGQISATNPPRNLQFGLRLSF
jgi:hypothetical protein